LRLAMAPIDIGTVLRRWIEVLAAAYFAWREALRARQSLTVARENGRFIVRGSRPDCGNGVRHDDPNEPEETVAVLTAGARIPAEVTRAARTGLIVFELPADLVVVRRIAVPVQAREFLPGIVRNQIERLSPWYADQVVYGFDADVDEEDAATLDVRVLIALRTAIDKARDELAATGLRVDRIVARQLSSACPPPHGQGDRTWDGPPSPSGGLGEEGTFRKLKLAIEGLWRRHLTRPTPSSPTQAGEERERADLSPHAGRGNGRGRTQSPPSGEARMAAKSITLWSRVADVSPEHLARTVRRVSVGIAAAAAASLALSLWAISSAASLGGESEEVEARVRTLQRQIQGPAAQSLASLSPSERAWYAKETAPTAAIVLEALSRALPDGAYLTELRLENSTLRIIGLAKDAPSLIASLEHSGHLTDVHFFAPTTRGQKDTLFRFNIEAHVEPHFKIAEDVP
jgi:Tfp pilus assembly protein PilN